jgi:tight adherence protein B
MRLAARLGLAAFAVAALAGVASAASSPLQLVEAGGAAYPQKSYILTLPYAKALQRTDLHITENGKPVTGVSVAHQGTQASKTAVVLLIDESQSMRGRPLAAAFAAARAFARHANAGQQIAVVTFNGNVNVLQPLTTNPSQIDSALSKPPDIVYGTKLYDSLQQALQMIDSAGTPSGAVIILTDGRNVGSKAKPGSVLSALAAAHVRVFSVGITSPSYDQAALEQMASQTGGSYVQAASTSDLKPILGQLGRRLSREYLVTYTSRANPNTRVVVSLAIKGVPGTVSTAYTTPPLKIVPAAPYKPSQVDTAIQSRWAMLVVALLFALLIGFAVSHATASREDPLVSRVGDFVAVQRPLTGSPTIGDSEARRRSLFLARLSQSTSRSAWSERLAATLELADIEADPIQVVVLTIVATILAALVLGLIFGIGGVIVALSLPFLVRYYIHQRIARKRRAFAEQLPDNLDVLASALRAGHSLVSALSVVADDAPEPSKSEFRRVLGEEQFGVNLEDALQVAVSRMQNQELDQVALVARLQREVGSNSAEVLDKVIETVRARMDLRRLVRTLTAQGRLSRWILTLLPLGLLVAMALIAPSYLHPLFHQKAGQVLLVFAAILVALGSWFIGKIIDIKV